MSDMTADQYLLKGNLHDQRVLPYQDPTLNADQITIDQSLLDGNTAMGHRRIESSLTAKESILES